MVDVSPSIETTLGIPREEWLARAGVWEDAIHPDDRERVVEVSRHAAEFGEPFRIEYRAFHRDGRMLWIREDCVLIRDEVGEPVYWLGLMLDVSEFALAPARPAGGADEVRGARRTDPGDRLHRRSRRAHDHHVREPADRTVAGLHPARLHDRSRPLDLDAASRRPGRRRRDLPARTRVRRTVRVRVPPGRQGRERRLVPRLGDRAAGRRGPPPVHPGRDAGHHRAQGRRGTDRLPRLPRQAHRPVEPGDVRRAARAHDGARPAQRPRASRWSPWTSTTSSW